jgi:hypothetical protein
MVKKYEIMEALYIVGDKIEVAFCNHVDYVVADATKDIEIHERRIEWEDFEEYCMEQRDNSVHDTVDHEGKHVQNEFKPELQGYIKDNFNRLIESYMEDKA